MNFLVQATFRLGNGHKTFLASRDAAATLCQDVAVPSRRFRLCRSGHCRPQVFHRLDSFVRRHPVYSFHYCRHGFAPLLVRRALYQIFALSCCTAVHPTRVLRALTATLLPSQFWRSVVMVLCHRLSLRHRRLKLLDLRKRKAGVSCDILQRENAVLQHTLCRREHVLALAASHSASLNSFHCFAHIAPPFF